MVKRFLRLLGLVAVVCLLAGGLTDAAGAARAIGPAGPADIYHSPYIVISDTNNWKYSPAIAYNSKHDQFLVAWENRWGNGLHDIYARRVSGSGQLLGTFVVTAGPENRMNPAVAYDSTHDQYLVVWGVNTGTDVDPDWDVAGRFIPWDGPSASQTEFGIITDRANTGKPRLVYGLVQDEFLVVWKGADDLGDPTWIDGALVFDSHSAIGVPISSTAGDHDYPDLTYNLHNNEFMVVWDVFKPVTGLDVYALRLDGNGKKLGGGEFPLAQTTSAEQHPTVAACSKADQYMFVWQNQVNLSADDNLYGFWMNWDPGVGDYRSTDTYGIEGTTLPQQFPRLACNTSGTEYMLTWHDQYANPLLCWGVWGATITTNMVVQPAWQVVQPDGPPYLQNCLNRILPAVAYGGQSALVAWEHDRNDSSGYLDIWAQLLKPHVLYAPAIKKP